MRSTNYFNNVHIQKNDLKTLKWFTTCEQWTVKYQCSLTAWTVVWYTNPLSMAFSTGDFKDGNTVFNFLIVVTILQGSFIRLNALSKFSVIFPRYCIKTNFRFFYFFVGHKLMLTVNFWQRFVNNRLVKWWRVLFLYIFSFISYFRFEWKIWLKKPSFSHIFDEKFSYIFIYSPKYCHIFIYYERWCPLGGLLFVQIYLIIYWLVTMFVVFEKLFFHANSAKKT